MPKRPYRIRARKRPMTRVSYRKSDDLRHQLLDTAETLFSIKGYYGVSVRDITNELGVRLASINYHFGSKENLFIEVIHRRIEPLSKARLTLLEAINIDPEKPEAAALMITKAFAGPMIDFAHNGGAGWRNYCRLVAQISAQQPMANEAMTKEYNPTAQKFITALKSTFPDLEEYRIQCCFQFLLGSTLYAVCDNKRIDSLSDEVFHSSDLEKISGPFYDYVTGGLLACAMPKKKM